MLSMPNTKKKISYKQFEDDLFVLYLREDLKYDSFESFVLYATSSDRFKEELGYSVKEVDFNANI